MIGSNELFDARYLGERILMVVAQERFTWGVNTFCTLIPLLDSRMTPVARERDFPSHGHIWWLITSQNQRFAEPGRLVMGTLEEARQADSPDKAYYQVIPDSVAAVSISECVEVIEIGHGALKRPQDLIRGDFKHLLDHSPCAIVYVKYQEVLYGPFRATSEMKDSGHYTVKFEPAGLNQIVYEIPQRDLADQVVSLKVLVSTSDRAIYQGGAKVERAYSLVSPKAIDPALSHVNHAIWKNPGDIVREIAKRLFDDRLILKKDRREFVNIFQDIEEVVLQSPDILKSQEERDILDLIRKNIDHIQAEAQQVANALVKSELIADQVAIAIEKGVEEHIERNTAQLRAKIESQVVEKQNKLASLTQEAEMIEAQLALHRKKREAEVEVELRLARVQLDRREEEILEMQASLDRERQVVQQSLQGVAEQLKSGKKEIIAQFLTLAPLLESIGYLAVGKSEAGKEVEASKTDEMARPTISWSPFVNTAARGERQAAVSEMDFFDRFRLHVESSGFGHRPIDLLSMHISCKCHDITILGGQPGTGKSSLPRLYMEALQGSDSAIGTRHLHVGVSPSWADGRDLLGFVNAFERTFQPSESGVYMHLVNACEEYRLRGSSSGVWMICLDEMNLAQVEHYFGSFIQALERPEGERTIACFAPETISAENPLAPWANLNLPSTVRFVGTVNFDETTHQLSQRLLDRANLIRLRPPRESLNSFVPLRRIEALGQPISVADIASWIQPSERISPVVGEILDELSEPLSRLGCALNPRRSRAIARFIANTPSELCPPEKALDLQIAQRLLPRVRSLFKAGATEQFEQLKKILTQRGEFEESLNVLEEIAGEGLSGHLFADV